MKSNAIDNNVSERPLIIGRVNRQNTGLLYIVVRDFNSKQTIGNIVGQFGVMNTKGNRDKMLFRTQIQACSFKGTSR